MAKRNSVKGLVVMGLALGLAGVMSISAFATSTSSSNTAKTTAQAGTSVSKTTEVENGKFDSTQALADLKTKLAALVKDGKLTQAKADKVYAYFEKNKPVEGKKMQRGNGPISQLVADGTITSAEAEIIRAALPHHGHGPGHGGEGRMNGLLDDMVKDGVINKATSEKISDYMEKHGHGSSSETAEKTSN